MRPPAFWIISTPARPKPPSNPLVELVDIPCDNRFRAAFHRGDSDLLAVCFSGVGQQRYEMPPFEMVNSATQNGQHSALFVSDMTRSWHNAAGFNDWVLGLIAELRADIGSGPTVALGNSMGGYSALMIAKQIELAACISITPQYSPNPDTMPHEKRWMFFRREIKNFAFDGVQHLPTDHCEFYVMHGGGPREHLHWRRFPQQENMTHFIMKGYGHNLAKRFKSKGILNLLIRNGLKQRTTKFKKLLTENGGVPRAIFEARHQMAPQ